MTIALDSTSCAHTPRHQSETQKPLAMVVIGGLISATLLPLIVLPTL